MRLSKGKDRSRAEERAEKTINSNLFFKEKRIADEEALRRHENNNDINVEIRL